MEPHPSISSVFWSLAVEEHFYLVWPWLVKVCSRRSITLIALAMRCCPADSWNSRRCWLKRYFE